MTNTRPYQITAELLSALQMEGYALGVDKHLQIQTLLNKLPDDLTDEALKCALIPLLAQSPAEQEQLYGVFDDCVKRVNELPIDITPSVKDDEKTTTTTFPKVSNSVHYPQKFGKKSKELSPCRRVVSQ